MEEFEKWWAEHTARAGFAADPDFLSIAKSWALSAWNEAKERYDVKVTYRPV